MTGCIGSRTTSKALWPRSHGPTVTAPVGHPGVAELPSSIPSSQKGMADIQSCKEPGGLPVGHVWTQSVGFSPYQQPGK